MTGSLWLDSVEYTETFLGPNSERLSQVLFIYLLGWGGGEEVLCLDFKPTFNTCLKKALDFWKL